MRRARWIVFAAIVASLTLMNWAQERSRAASKRPVLSVDEVSRSKVTGGCGIEPGEVFTIEGTVITDPNISKARERVPALRIELVGDQKLREPVIFLDEDVQFFSTGSPRLGDVVGRSDKLAVYETGRMHGRAAPQSVHPSDPVGQFSSRSRLVIARDLALIPETDVVSPFGPKGK